MIRHVDRILRGFGMADIDFQASRVKMVDGQLRTTDVTGHAILSAFLEIPRERFVPTAMRDLAYVDHDIEVAPGRFAMEPSPLAKLLQLAAITASDKVLIIGAATGYGAAIAGKLAASVVAVESNGELCAQMAANLKAVGISNVETMTAGLGEGARAKGPFNVIILEGSVSAVPVALFDQLCEDGRLVAVEGEGHTGVARLYMKTAKNVSSVRGFNVSVKPLPELSKKPEFAF
jgi:protein-L-isoaspartate(D-aspartate) O-methyltransferase